MEPTLQEQTVIVYDGDRCENGLYQGYGRAVFSSGQVYEGHWAAGHMQGAGRVSFPDGITYEGSLNADRITGRGVYRWSGAVYEGELQDGERHGYGTLTFCGSEVVYEGQWQFGRRHGTGTIYYNEQRTAYYEGQWENDMKHGQGTSMYPSGNSYSGSWVNDRRHGFGTMRWVTKGQVYTGEWVDNLPNGLGQHVWQQGTASLQASNHAMHVMFNRYHGMFKDGHRHGEGTLWYSNGARYEGQWMEDKKHGEGIYVFEDGSIFVGRFEADRPLCETGKFLGATTISEVDGATDATYQSGEQTLSCDTAPMTSGSSGFGPRVNCLQLYISDLLQELDTPTATYRAVSNLLIMYNSELRSLYDSYSNRPSPLLDCDAPRNSWALQAGQLWELLRDSLILCRQLQLQQACCILHKVLQPPPAVTQRRQQVTLTTDAPAVIGQLQQQYNPTIELLFRDLCEFLIRVAAVRYPQLPCLEQQVQQLITQNLLPLLGPTSAKSAGCRQSVLAVNRTSVVSPVAVLSAGTTPGSCRTATIVGSAGVSKMRHEQLQQEDLTLYLRSQADNLKHVYAIFAASPSAAQQITAGTAAQQLEVQAPISTEALPDDTWLITAVTVRQVVAVLQQACVLQKWQLDETVVALLLLEGFSSVAEPQTPRAHIDEADLEPSDIDQPEAPDTPQHAAELTMQRELAHWVDVPVLLIELVWGLVRCAAALPPDLAPDSKREDLGAADSCSTWGLLPRLQYLLEGKGGLLSLLPAAEQGMSESQSPEDNTSVDEGEQASPGKDGNEEAPCDDDDDGDESLDAGAEAGACEAEASRPTTTQSSASSSSNCVAESCAVQAV